jgi:hypothetical protein
VDYAHLQLLLLEREFREALPSRLVLLCEGAKSRLELVDLRLEPPSLLLAHTCTPCRRQERQSEWVGERDERERERDRERQRQRQRETCATCIMSFFLCSRFSLSTVFPSTFPSLPLSYSVMIFLCPECAGSQRKGWKMAPLRITPPRGAPPREGIDKGAERARMQQRQPPAPGISPLPPRSLPTPWFACNSLL